MEKLVTFEVQETLETNSAYKIDNGNIKSREFYCSPFLISFTEWYHTLVVTLEDRNFLYIYKIVQAH